MVNKTKKLLVRGIKKTKERRSEQHPRKSEAKEEESEMHRFMREESVRNQAILEMFSHLGSAH